MRSVLPTLRPRLFWKKYSTYYEDSEVSCQHTEVYWPFLILIQEKCVFLRFAILTQKCRLKSTSFQPKCNPGQSISAWPSGLFRLWNWNLSFSELASLLSISLLCQVFHLFPTNFWLKYTGVYAMMYASKSFSEIIHFRCPLIYIIETLRIQFKSIQFHSWIGRLILYSIQIGE